MKRIMDEKRLVVISGPSGCGKDSVVNELVSSRTDMALSVSSTSRPKREYEAEGEHYYFLSREEFERQIERGMMLEHTQYSGHFYGTSLAEIEDKLRDDKTVILIIETTGASNIKKEFPDSLRVFVAPPSLEELERRLRLRGSESDPEIEKRLEIARREMARANEYDYVIINDEVKSCADRLMEIIGDWQRTH